MKVRSGARGQIREVALLGAIWGRGSNVNKHDNVRRIPTDQIQGGAYLAAPSPASYMWAVSNPRISGRASIGWHTCGAGAGGFLPPLPEENMVVGVLVFGLAKSLGQLPHGALGLSQYRATGRPSLGGLGGN